MDRILLDPFRESKPPNGYIIIKSEISFLENALSQAPLYVQGDMLCKWAEVFFKGRNIRYKYTRSIVRELLKNFPFLNQVTANKIFSILEGNSNTDIKLPSKEILKGCFPNEIWEKEPSKEHAAEWLLWLDKTMPDDLFTPFLRMLNSNWLEKEPRFELAYNCIEPDNARTLLEKWICCSDFEVTNYLGSFPLEVPKNWYIIKNEYWDNEVIKSRGRFFLEFLNHESNHQDKLIVVANTIEYFRSNPKEIDDEIYKKLSQFATGKELATLAKLKPLDMPNNLPEQPGDVLHWFKEEYLPYRQRSVEVEDEVAKKESIDKARQFSDWYLEYYPKAIAKGKGIASFRTYEIKEKNKNYINLLIILDGLNALDGQLLLNEILSNNLKNKLNLVENSYTFSLLPTVTQFTKNRLVHGTLSNNFDKLEKLGIDVPDKNSPSNDLSNAEPGDIIIWRIQEPDYTYHKEGQSKDLAIKIAGQMVIINKRIQDAIENTPLYLPLRILITTDHGRILGKSNRTVKVPEGMIAHGRAAWGKKDIQFSSKGYLIEDNIVYLSKETYHLDDLTAAVIFTDEAFIHETYTEEISPHGGLFPEEVILPWMVFERNIEKPSFRFRISGSGQANKESIAAVYITNPSSYNAKLVSVEFNFGTHVENNDCGFEILPKKENIFDLSVKNWPSKDQTQTGNLKVEISLPNGEILITTISLEELKSESMYSRDNILNDLL